LLVTDRVFSISAGLDASTVTPGSTAPDASRTVPTIEACANTVAGISATDVSTITRSSRCIINLRRAEELGRPACGVLGIVLLSNRMRNLFRIAKRA
jgi:hypothetical protein